MKVLSVSDTRNPDYKIVNFKPGIDEKTKQAKLYESRPVASSVLDEIPEGYEITFVERS